MSNWRRSVDLGPFSFRAPGGFAGGVVWRREDGAPVFAPPGSLPDRFTLERPDPDPEEWERRAREFHRGDD